MLNDGNQSSFRARNKSRTAIISIHDQPSNLSLWNEVDCYVCNQLWKRHSFYICEIVHRTFGHAHICMLTTFSVPTKYDIYFFMYGNSSSYCWSEDDCCVQPAEKSLSFMCDICASCIVQRYIRFTVICREPPPQYPLNIIYTFLLHWFSSIRQVGGWYRLSSCVGH